MRLKVIIQLLSANAAFIAFILSLLCIFVGSREGYFEDYYILVVRFSHFHSMHTNSISLTLPSSPTRLSIRYPPTVYPPTVRPPVVSPLSSITSLPPFLLASS